MLDSNEKYLNLITYEHANQPKFKSYVEAFLLQLSQGTHIDQDNGTENATGAVNVLHLFSDLLNLDTAVGDQLDQIGSQVGISRVLPINNVNISPTLSDDSYRLVIKAKILKNHWDGSREQMEQIIEAIYPDISWTLVDNQDMTITVNIIDPNITDEQQALLENGFILPKPSGVRMIYNVSRTALFGWDRDDDKVQGWDEGLWSNI